MSNSDNPYANQGAGHGYDGGGQQLTGEVSFGAPPTAGAAAPAGIPAPGNGGAADLIKDTTTAAFRADVIEQSRRQPVLVDFWAPWCGPCKQLTPILEKAVKAAKGRVRLVKLNIDEHPAIPGQMGVQSIPAVIAFVNGQPVDGFMGAVPEGQINAFIDKVAGPAGADEKAEIEAVLAEARALLKDGDVPRAAQMFDAVLRHDPENVAAKAGLAECLIAAGRREEAVAMLDALPEKERAQADLARILARIALEDEAAKLGDPAALNARIAADPTDFQARMDLAKILNMRGERDAAADQLLAVMRADRQWQDDGARRELLVFFDAWGPTDPATLAARRKLSSILFS